MKKEQSIVVQQDNIPEHIHKRLHIIYFILKCILGVMVFLLVYIPLITFVFDVPQSYSEDSPFLHHEYCGTFFVELNKDNSFASPESYSAYLEKKNEPHSTDSPPMTEELAATVIGIVLLLIYTVLHIKKKLPRLLEHRYAKTILAGIVLFLFTNDLPMTAFLIMLACIFLALRSGDKKTVFYHHSYEYFMISGFVWLFCNLVTEIGVILHTKEQGDGMIGVFSDPIYYCQLYRILTIPVIVICAGLMLQRYELIQRTADMKTNTKQLKIICAAILLGTTAFVAYRLPVRIYELVKVMSGEEYSVRIPFTVMDNSYKKLIRLPFELAATSDNYRELILFRFIKDCPVFILSVVAVIYFVRVLLEMIKGELNNAKNRKYLNISIILLVAASLWFNLLGLREITILNSGFTGIYGDVVYTIALRSMTEPVMYAVILWFFKTYLQAIPEKE